MEAQRDAEIMRAVMPRHANSRQAPCAIRQTRSVVKTANFLLQTPYAEHLLAYVIHKRYAVAQTLPVHRTSMPLMVKIVEMVKNAQLDNVHLETCSVSSSWARILMATTTHMPVTAKLANLAAQVLNLDQAFAMVYSKISSTARTVVVAENAQT